MTQEEAVDDTLLAAGESVVIDGVINGDLLAAARRVVVNGTVIGNLIAFGADVAVYGNVGGTVVSAAETVEISDAVLKGDLWAAGDKIRIKGQSQIGRNTTLATESAMVEGKIDRDLYVFAENIELNGEIGGDLEAFTHKVNLLSDALIGGNLRFRTEKEENLQLASGATVVGEVEFLSMPKDFKPRNPYAHWGFYSSQFLRLGAAFVFGFALLWMLPGLRAVTLEGGVDTLKSAGIGLVALISLPIIAVLVAFTLVGIPFTVLGLFSWVFVIYFSKIVLAPWCGRMLLSSTEKADSLALTLLVGLLAILVAVNLPAIGGVINVLMTIIGAGILVKMFFVYLANRPA